jgi:hypothetical protein
MLLRPVRKLAVMALLLAAAGILSGGHRRRSTCAWPIFPHVTHVVPRDWDFAYLWLNDHTLTRPARIAGHQRVVWVDWPSGDELGFSDPGGVLGAHAYCWWGSANPQGRVVWLDNFGQYHGELDERAYVVTSAHGQPLARFPMPRGFQFLGNPVWLNTPSCFVGLSRKGRMLYALIGDMQHPGRLQPLPIAKLTRSDADGMMSLLSGVTRSGVVVVMFTRWELEHQGCHPGDRLLTFRIENSAVRQVHMQPIPVHPQSGAEAAWIELAADPCTDHLAWLVQYERLSPNRIDWTSSYQLSNSDGTDMHTVAEQPGSSDHMPIELRWRPDGRALSVMDAQQIHVIPILAADQ